MIDKNTRMADEGENNPDSDRPFAQKVTTPSY